MTDKAKLPAEPVEYTCPRCGSNVSTHICMKAEPVAGEASQKFWCPRCNLIHKRNESCPAPAVAVPEGALEMQDADWIKLPIGSWFFHDSPNCVNRYSVQLRTDEGCRVVCSTGWTADWAIDEMKGIVASHNAKLAVPEGEANEVSETLGKYLNTMVADLGIEGRGQYLRDLFRKYEAELRATPPTPPVLTREIRELLCQQCDRDYPVWFAPNELWNKVAEGLFHFLCMDCFAILAQSKGIKPTAWMVSEENIELSVALEKIRRLEHPELGSSLMESQPGVSGERMTAERFYKEFQLRGPLRDWITTREDYHREKAFEFADTFLAHVLAEKPK